MVCSHSIPLPCIVLFHILHCNVFIQTEFVPFRLLPLYHSLPPLSQRCLALFCSLSFTYSLIYCSFSCQPWHLWLLYVFENKWYYDRPHSFRTIYTQLVPNKYLNVCNYFRWSETIFVDVNTSRLNKLFCEWVNYAPNFERSVFDLVRFGWPFSCT